MKKIYVCYRRSTSNDPDMEFWTINKRLYQEYVDMYEPYLKSDSFIHRIYPISRYQYFVNKCQSLELKVYTMDHWMTPKPIKSITNMTDMSVIDLEEFICHILRVYDMNSNVFNILPFGIQRVFKSTRWYWMIIHDSSDVYLQMLDGFKVDYLGLDYLAHLCYYSNEELEDIPVHSGVTSHRRGDL